MDQTVRLLTVVQAAALLGLGRSLVYELVLRGEIPSIKIGRARRIPVAALDRFIDQRLEDSGNSPERRGDAGN